MTIGSTAGVLPPAMPASSLILGDHLPALQSQWLAPLNADQQLWVNNIGAVANGAPSAGVPATFAAAASSASIAQAAGLRFAMTGAAADLNKAVGVLLNAALPANNSNDFITHPEVLTSYLSAYDFVRGASSAELSSATRSTIETRLASLTSGLSYGNNTFSNARAKIGATKGLAGVMLADQALLDAALADMQGHFNYSTTDDGWFTDSQGHYLLYTLRHVSLFARAYEQGSGVDLYPNFQPYLDMSLGLRKPDGAMPNVSNGLNAPLPLNLFSATGETAAAAASLWNLQQAQPSPFPWTSVNVLNNDNSYSTFFALTEFTNPATAPAQSPTFLATGQSQVSVFRQNWGPTSDYLLLSPGIDSPRFFFQNEDPPFTIDIPAFHSHNDTGEILLSSGGKYLLVAPGYNRTDLSNSPAGFQPQRADWHNVILVDGDVGASDQGRKMRPEHFVHTDRLDSSELGDHRGVSDFATLQMQYRDTNVSRSTAFAGEDYFVVADRMQSATPHAYGFNLVGRGTQTVETSGPDRVDVRWEHEGQAVIEHLISTHAMTLSTSQIWMHDTFNDFEQTRRMTANISAENGQFLSVLETLPAGASSDFSIHKLSGPAVDYLSLEVQSLSQGWTDFVLSQQSAAVRAVGGMTSDAEYAYARMQAGVTTAAMWAGGTRFETSDLHVETTSPLTASLAVIAADEIRGTISSDGITPGVELRFLGRGPIEWATLGGVPLAPMNTPQFAAIGLTGGGELRVRFAAIPEPTTLSLLICGAVSLFLIRRRAR